MDTEGWVVLTIGFLCTFMRGWPLWLAVLIINLLTYGNLIPVVSFTMFFVLLAWEIISRVCLIAKRYITYKFGPVIGQRAGFTWN